MVKVFVPMADTVLLPIFKPNTAAHDFDTTDAVQGKLGTVSVAEDDETEQPRM